MNFTFQSMNEQYARAIAAWHYEPPYDFYDMEQDQEDLEELLNPANWPDRYVVLDRAATFIGFFRFRQTDNAVLEIGLGLRPDLTGKGLGLAFLESGLAFALARYAPAHFNLSVAAFNTRAIKIYERAGFKPISTYMQHTNGGLHEFVRMTRLA